ncbi:MAG: PGF-CTERM sorting domain-containing protein [Halobacteriales archaeon]
MSHERLLVGGGVVLLAAAVVAAFAVPGVVAHRDREPEGPGKLAVRDMAIKPGEISGETAELEVRTRVSHAGPPAENITVELRAIDLESGLLEATTTVAVEPIKSDREVTINGSLQVKREGGYRIEAVIYHEGRRIQTANRRVEGVGALQPAYADSPVDFHEFRATDQPSIEYRIAETTNQSATLAVTTYLTNTGDAPAGGLRLVLKARQADSGIVADSTEVSIGSIEAGRTATPSAKLTVPDGYNYYLDAQLWADGVIVGTARSAANLNPTETLSVNQTTREIGLEVSDFEPGMAEQTRDVEGTPTGAATSGQPGFTAVLAVLSLLVVALLARRVKDE